MKKVLIVTLSLFLLAGCAPKQTDPNQTSQANQTTTPESKNLEDVLMPGDLGYVGEEEPEPIDFVQIKSEAVGRFTETYPDDLYARQFDFSVDEGAKTITILATIPDNSNPDEVLVYANFMIRQLNDEIFMAQDDSLDESSDTSYGGIYETFSLSLTIAPEGAKDDSSKAFIKADIPAGSVYKPLELAN